MRRILLVGCTLLTLASPVPAKADPVELTIHDGRVSLVATNATVRQILAEWARIGRTRIVNGERVPGGLVTLQLTNVPEAEALDLLLRTAAGYIAAPREAGPSDGSRFDRILILPTSAAPPAAARVTPAPAPTPNPRAQAPPPPPPQPPQPMEPIFVPSGAQRVIGPDGQPIPDDQEGAPDAPRPLPQPYVPLPPGFSEPPDPATRATDPRTAPTGRPGIPVGVPVPGMVVPVPVQPGVPREVQPRGPQQP
jgi:hypothetical protein